MKRTIKLFVSICFLFLITIQKLILVLLKRKSNPKFLVFYYHSVPKSQLDYFIWQIKFLNKFGRIVPCDFTNPEHSKSRYFAITFDDGFISVAENALPELKKLNAPSTIFIPTNYIDMHPAWNLMGEDYNRDEKILSKDQIKELNSKLVKFGSHTLNHANLKLLNNADLMSELLDSKQNLEEITGEKITTLSFPYGSYNDAVIQTAFKINYKFLFNSEPSTSQLNKIINIGIRGRVPVDFLETKLEFIIKAFGGYNWLSIYIQLKRKLRKQFNIN